MKFYIFFLLSFSVFSQDFVTGIISREGSEFYIINDSEKLRIETTELIRKSLPSLNGKNIVKQANGQPYSFEFKGRKKSSTFALEQVPTIIPGTKEIKAVLRYDEETKEYNLSGVPATFGYTKKISGYSHDEKSRKQFVGWKVIAEGDYDDNGTFVIQAITPRHLFNAEKSIPYADIDKIVQTKGGDYLATQIMIRDENSMGRLPSYRTTFFNDSNTTIKAGDSALIVTLSGRQGDTFGSVNGHMVAGLAEVKDDLSLRAEVSNAYVTNEKDILSGNTSLTSYYSHLVQGQNNYRPTYTLIVYGIDPAKLKQFRDALEASHIEFREKKLDITPQFNCTTETVKALEVAGIEGNYSQYDNYLKGFVTSPLGLFSSKLKTLNFALGNDASRFHPRPAFESFVRAFESKKYRKKLGVTRVDYVFYNQLKSNRPVGGMALGEPFRAPKFNDYYEEYEKNEATKLSKDELNQKLNELLSDVVQIKK